MVSIQQGVSEQYVAEVPKRFDFLPTADKERIGHHIRILRVVSENVSDLVEARIPENDNRSYSKEEVMKIVEWASKAAINGTLLYDVCSDDILSDEMATITDDPDGTSFDAFPAPKIPIIED